MVRPIEQEMIAIEMIVCYSSRDEGTHHSMQGHTGKHQGQSGGRGSVGRLWARALTVVFRGRNR